MTFLWGLSPHVAKFAIEKSPIPYIVLRQISAGLISVGVLGVMIGSRYLKRKDVFPQKSGKMISLCLLAGLMSAVSIAICTWLIFTIKIPSVVNGLTYPLGLLATVLIGAFFGDEKLSDQQKLGLGFAVIASYFLCQTNAKK